MKDNSTDFNEENIRPAKFDNGHLKAILEDVKMLKSKQSEFVTTSCPACNLNKFTKQFSKRGFNYVRCHRCETVFINPRPSQNTLDWFYRESKNYSFWNTHIFPATEKSRHENIIMPRVKKTIELCQKYNVIMNSILEVGAGFGTFCMEIQSEGLFKRVIAVEPTPSLAETCRKRGIETIERPIEKIEFSEKKLFNVIVNFEVIEHLFSPRDFLTHIFNLLEPEGIVIISCPNYKGFEIETLGVMSDSIDHEHLNYFNPKSISMLLDSCGFRVLEVFTPGKLDTDLVRKKILDGEFDSSKNYFLYHILVEEWDSLGSRFQKFLADNLLSSNMWAVAQKPRLVVNS